MFTETLEQQLALVDFTNFSNAAAASYNTTAPIDMSKFKRAMYVVVTGLFTASGTLDGRIQSCQFVSFNTAVHNIAATNITQLTASNTFAKTEIRADQVVAANSADRYVRLNTTVGTAAVNYAIVGFGGESEQGPANQYENTTIVTSNIAPVP